MESACLALGTSSGQLDDWSRLHRMYGMGLRATACLELVQSACSPVCKFVD